MIVGIALDGTCAFGRCFLFVLGGLAAFLRRLRRLLFGLGLLAVRLRDELHGRVLRFRLLVVGKRRFLDGRLLQLFLPRLVSFLPRAFLLGPLSRGRLPFLLLVPSRSAGGLLHRSLLQLLLGGVLPLLLPPRRFCPPGPGPLPLPLLFFRPRRRRPPDPVL